MQEPQEEIDDQSEERVNDEYIDVSLGTLPQMSHITTRESLLSTKIFCLLLSQAVSCRYVRVIEARELKVKVNKFEK